MLDIAGVAGLAAFAWRETRAVEPILPLSVFRSRNLTVSCRMIFVVGVAMFGAVSFLPLYQQSVQHASATNSGLLLLPMVVPIIALFGALFNHQIARAGTHAYLTGVSNAIDAIFVCCTAVAAACFAMAWFIKEVPLRGKPGADKPSAGKPGAGDAAQIMQAGPVPVTSAAARAGAGLP